MDKSQVYITDVEHCTHCGEPIKDIKILLRLNYVVYRETASETWEKVDNTDVSSNEMLCKTCFDRFVNSIDGAMNQEKS